MRKRPLIAAAGVLILLIAGAIGYLWSLEPGGPLAFYGTIETEEVHVGSLVGGRVAQVHVDEGDAVTKGSVLVSLDSQLLDPQIAEQEAQLSAARAVMARVEAGPRQEELERARLEYSLAERRREQLAELLQRGATTQKEYDDARERAGIARATYDELLAGSRSEDIEEARANVAREEQALAHLQQQRRELTVEAPVAGIVQTIRLRPGDLVQAYEPVASILEPDQLWVRIYVPETRLGLVQVGQRADIQVDTFPDRIFPGLVEEIRTQGEYTPRNIQTLEERQELVFAVRIEVRRTPELKAGMTATVRLKPPVDLAAEPKATP